MQVDALRDTVVAMASRKPRFLLSEAIRRSGGNTSPNEAREALAGVLAENGLAATPHGNDISVCWLPSPPLVPAGEARRAVDTYLSAPTMDENLQRLIEETVTRTAGKSWNSPAVLEHVRRAVRAQKEEYWTEGEERRPGYRSGYRLVAYLAYHFPVYFVQSQQILRECIKSGWLNERMVVLDLGTGPGTFPLAMADLYRRMDRGHAVVYAVERSEEGGRIARELLSAYERISSRVILGRLFGADLRNFDPAALPVKPNLIVCSNVINELGDTPEEIALHLSRYAASLAPGGIIILAEPADLDNAVRLRKVAWTLVRSGLEIRAPCRPLYGTECRAARCWTFVTCPPIRPTALMERVASCNEPYRYLNTDIKYAHAVLAKETTAKPGPIIAVDEDSVRFESLNLHRNRKINTVATVMSGDLGSGSTHLFRVCDGTGTAEVFAVLSKAQRSRSNRPLPGASCGDVLKFDGVLVRYNSDFCAWNLVVVAETRVTLPASGKKKSGKNRKT